MVGRPSRRAMKMGWGGAVPGARRRHGLRNQRLQPPVAGGVGGAQAVADHREVWPCALFGECVGGDDQARPIEMTKAARPMRPSASTAPSPYASANLLARLAARPKCGAASARLEASAGENGPCAALRRIDAHHLRPSTSNAIALPPWQVVAAEELLVKGRVAAFLVAGYVTLENDRASGFDQRSSAKRPRVRAKPPFRDELLEKAPMSGDAGNEGSPRA